MTKKHESETEYLIPAPVLTTGDKLFNFGFVAFSVAQMVELIAVMGVIFLLWKIFFFLPWQVMAAVSALLFFVAFLFITQPINGLPGDTWLKYAFRFYVLERNRHIIYRRGRNYVQVQHLRLLAKDGTTLVHIGDGTNLGSNRGQSGQQAAP